MNRHHAVLLLMLVVAVFAVTGCGSKNADYAVANANLAPDAIQVWNVPIVNTLEMDVRTTRGSAEASYILGIPFRGDFVQRDAMVIYDGVGHRSLSGLSALAASRGIDEVSADGLYVTRITAQRRGIVPIIYNIKYEVQGKPITIKESTSVHRDVYVGALTHPEAGPLRLRPGGAARGGVVATIMTLPPFSFFQ